MESEDLSPKRARLKPSVPNNRVIVKFIRIGDFLKESAWHKSSEKSEAKAIGSKKIIK